MAQRRRITVGGKTIWVDSKVEERFLQWIEANGFSHRWERPDIGLHAHGKNYTPDIYLMVEHEGRSHRAVVEVKSVLDDWKYGFTDYVSRRMRRASRVYLADMLLLFVDDTETWYRVDRKTGMLTEFGVPTPARLTIDKAYKPFTVRARSVRSHRYKQRLDGFIAKSALSATADMLEGSIKILFGPTKRKSHRSYRKHK